MRAASHNSPASPAMTGGREGERQVRMPGEEAKQPRLETWHCPSWDSQLWVSFPSLYPSIQIWKLVMVRINAKHLAQGASLVADCKESTCNARGPGSIPGSGRSSGEQNGYPLQYPCLENPKDIGAGQAIVHWGHKESDTAEQHTHTNTHTHTLQTGCPRGDTVVRIY